MVTKPDGDAVTKVLIVYQYQDDQKQTMVGTATLTYRALLKGEEVIIE